MARILIIGSGGREHALAWAIHRSHGVDELHIAPGNGGTGDLARSVPIPVDDINALADYAETQLIDLTVVGPEVPLALGLADAFQERGLRVFGPTAAAARIESSKAFSKDFMRAHGIPTAEYGLFDDYDQARSFLESHSAPIWIKASGLAAGKGAIGCQTDAEALEALDKIMKERAFGAAGDVVVIEEHLSGQEVTVLAFCDGHTVTPMILAQDHKAAYDGDRGPNTGGMGCYAPAPLLDEATLERVVAEILQPTVDGLAAAGSPYVGVLYAGLMVSDDPDPDINVLEFNCRFGDPKAQAILPLLETDLHAVLDACVESCLDQIELQWTGQSCACVVMASGGYPDSYERGFEITGLDRVAELPNTMVFHAGTRVVADADGEEKVVTDGGRVLGVTAWADDLESAVARAYAAVDHIRWPGVMYRRDIGAKALHSAQALPDANR